MEFRFGEDVRREDGTTLGEVRGLAYDTGTQQIVSIVVQAAGLDERQVVLPIGAVDSSDDNAVTVALSDEQFASLDSFVAEEVNLAPPPDAGEIDEDQITDPIDVPDVPPIGAATGIESIAFTPIVQDTENIPGDAVVIDNATTVWATDGQIALIRDVRVSDETNRIDALVLQHGDLEGPTYVPADWITGVEPGTVVLSVTRDQVLAAGAETNA